MHVRSAAFALVLLLAGAPAYLSLGAPASPIVIRHDRDDARYLELGERYAAVGKIGRGGDGTLIAPGWVLTAAHVASGMRRRARELHVTFGEHSYHVAQVVLHPEWTEMGPHDLALLRLAEPVAGIAPVPLYPGNEETGHVATLVGHGDVRTGMGGAWASDGKRRAATNRVDRADAQWLYFTFDTPPAGTDLEGTPGRGDSGGPALLTIDGAAYVAGVSSLGRDGRYGPGTYGAVDHFVRVASYRGWIEETMAAPPETMPSASIDPLPQPGAAASLPNTPTGRHMRAFLDVVASADEAALQAFITRHFSADALADHSSEARRPALLQLVETLRGATLSRVVRDTPTNIEVILSATDGGQRVLRFLCEPNAPYGIEGVMTGRIDGR